MPKFTIYLPDELSDRLGRLKEQGARMNASQVCQHALEDAARREEEALRGRGLGRLLQRLESARSPREQALDSGRRAGREWAYEVASETELKEVALLRPLSPREWNGRQLRVTDPDGESHTVTLPESIDMDGWDREHLFDSLNGFADGAGDVWDLVAATRNTSARLEELWRMRDTWQLTEERGPEVRPWSEINGEEMDTLVRDLYGRGAPLPRPVVSATSAIELGRSWAESASAEEIALLREAQDKIRRYELRESGAEGGVPFLYLSGDQDPETGRSPMITAPLPTSVPTEVLVTALHDAYETPAVLDALQAFITTAVTAADAQN